MRKIILALSLSAMLSGCAALGAIPIVGPIISSIVTAPAVASATSTLCGLNPLIQDVTALIGANPLVTTVEAFANMICGAPVAASARKGAAGGMVVLRVNGITVRATRN